MTEATLPQTRTEGPLMPGLRIRFPEGLLGFPDSNDYELVDGPGDGLFWLRSEREDAPSFIVTDPFEHFEEYAFDLAPDQAERIGADEPSQVGVLAITVPNVETGVWTANLQGPVVINLETRLGTQVVLSDRSLGVRCPFRPSLVTRVQ